jgi:hypothetical protein
VVREAPARRRRPLAGPAAACWVAQPRAAAVAWGLRRLSQLAPRDAGAGVRRGAGSRMARPEGCPGVGSSA